MIIEVALMFVNKDKTKLEPWSMLIAVVSLRFNSPVAIRRAIRMPIVVNTVTRDY